MAWLERFKAYMLDSQQLFNLALVIGVLQIVFGMCLKVANLWKQFGLPAALSTIGWLVAILGGGACYWLSSQGYDVAVPAYAILIVAGLLVFVFNNLHRNVLVNVGAGIWDTYNMVTGLLGDTLSYIRLFALGISSAVGIEYERGHPCPETNIDAGHSGIRAWREFIYGLPGVICASDAPDLCGIL